MQKKLSKTPRPADFTILLFILSISIISFSFLPKGQTGKNCLLYFNGRPYGKFSLLEEKSRIDTIQTAKGMIVLKREIGRIKVIRSSCPHKICVNRGFIQKSGETIVCAPNRFMAVIPEDSGAFDAISR